MSEHYIPIYLAHLCAADIAKVHAYADKRLQTEREKDIIDASEWQGSYEQEQRKRVALEAANAALIVERDQALIAESRANAELARVKADLVAANKAVGVQQCIAQAETEALNAAIAARDAAVDEIRKIAGLQRQADARFLWNLAKHPAPYQSEPIEYAGNMVSKNTLVSIDAARKEGKHG